MSYRSAGVDIDAAEHAKNLMTVAVRRTHGPAVLAGIGAFGGAFALGATLQKMTDPVLVASTDGVGTKTMVATAVGRFDTVGQDLVNHCINDVLVQGARPLFFMDYFAAAQLDPLMVERVVSGVATACEAAGCALLGGETAEMPGIYMPQAFDLAGTLVGVVDRAQLITGAAIRSGDVVLGLPSNGLHTNGYSLARKICEPIGYAATPPELGGVSLGDALLEVHRSYLPQLDTLWGAGLEIKGMAHLTGGGIINNLPRVLPEGLSATIHTGTWPVPPIFAFLLRSVQLDPIETYRTFNMGIGMALIVAPEKAAAARAAVEELVVIGEIAPGQGVTLV
ncbi:MAG: phosphoribosylformylglycinamidine cyclo-ligase [Herpetosiphonaceae bacterium]|nr:phosphoribosylformylglycinamidine cyclo-ligase [Herpetosiphonaceae bacterium]